LLRLLIGCICINRYVPATVHESLCVSRQHAYETNAGGGADVCGCEGGERDRAGGGGQRGTGQ
jgi:hypothetical protein